MWSIVRWGRKWWGRSALNSDELCANNSPCVTETQRPDKIWTVSIPLLFWERLLVWRCIEDKEKMDVEETGETRTSWYVTFYIHHCLFLSLYAAYCINKRQDKYTWIWGINGIWSWYTSVIMVTAWYYCSVLAEKWLGQNLSIMYFYVTWGTKQPATHYQDPIQLLKVFCFRFISSKTT